VSNNRVPEHQLGAQFIAVIALHAQVFNRTKIWIPPHYRCQFARGFFPDCPRRSHCSYCFLRAREGSQQHNRTQRGDEQRNRA